MPHHRALPFLSTNTQDQHKRHHNNDKNNNYKRTSVLNRAKVDIKVTFIIQYRPSNSMQLFSVSNQFLTTISLAFWNAFDGVRQPSILITSRNSSSKHSLP